MEASTGRDHCNLDAAIEPAFDRSSNYGEHQEARLAAPFLQDLMKPARKNIVRELVAWAPIKIIRP